MQILSLRKLNEAKDARPFISLNAPFVCCFYGTREHPHRAIVRSTPSVLIYLSYFKITIFFFT